MSNPAPERTAPRTVPLVVRHRAGESAQVTLGDLPIENLLAADGLKIEYEKGSPAQPIVTMVFTRRSLEVDLDIDVTVLPDSTTTEDDQ